MQVKEEDSTLRWRALRCLCQVSILKQNGQLQTSKDPLNQNQIIKDSIIDSVKGQGVALVKALRSIEPQAEFVVI